jgi:XTP/dITP diphosphohydrolase
VRSARYAGEPSNTEANNRLLLSNLEGVADRSARFVCTIALVSPFGEEFTVEGICPGRILGAAAGTEGFGYDPLFQSDGSDRSFAELSADEKNAISHRARALAQMRKVLMEYSR